MCVYQTTELQDMHRDEIMGKIVYLKKFSLGKQKEGILEKELDLDSYTNSVTKQLCELGQLA